MSDILATNAIIAIHSPLLSPSSDPPSFSFLESTVPLYYMPPSPNSVSSDSPIPAARMLKSTSSDSEQLCLPTHQVFDFPEAKTLFLPSDHSNHDRLSISIDSSVAPSASKRSAASPAPSVTKKPRAVAERISTKDFVPPDVSGLTKREARLVKNRAAAFLSRQRKREEFEFMEMYDFSFARWPIFSNPAFFF